MHNFFDHYMILSYVLCSFLKAEMKNEMSRFTYQIFGKSSFWPKGVSGAFRNSGSFQKFDPGNSVIVSVVLENIFKK